MNLSKAVMIRDKKVLYDYVDVLQSWAEYNRKYENGNRTETLSVGSTPGSLKID